MGAQVHLLRYDRRGGPLWIKLGAGHPLLYLSRFRSQAEFPILGHERRVYAPLTCVKDAISPPGPSMKKGAQIGGLPCTAGRSCSTTPSIPCWLDSRLRSTFRRSSRTSCTPSRIT